MAKIRGLIRKYFSLTQSEWRGFLLASVFLIIAIVSRVISSRIVPRESFDYSEISGIIEELQRSEQTASPKTDRSFFPFDPNSIDEETIERLDIPERIKRNILKYRQSGGTFKKAEDLKKIFFVNNPKIKNFLILLYILIRKKLFFSLSKKNLFKNLLTMNDRNGIENIKKHILR